MSKKEFRQSRRGMSSAAGDVGKELAELERVQKFGRNPQNEILTITVGCDQLFTLICC